MRKLSSKIKALVFCLLILFVCTFSLISILTIQNAIAVLLAAICFATLRKLLYIKLK